jgi:hypothetical protein
MRLAMEYVKPERDSKIYEERLGGYNDLPPNWTEITESEWAWRFTGLRGVQFTDFRQAKMKSLGRPWSGGKHVYPPQEMYHNIHMWVCWDWKGLALVADYTGEATRSEVDAFKLRYFKFHYCDHDYETTVSRMCYREMVCKKCGTKDTIDSSG